jgi:hypothetical protein
VPGHVWWLLPELLAALLVAMLMLHPGPARAADLSAQLADEVVRILEGMPPAEHQDHGHTVAAEDRVLCVAEIIGMEPADAATIADVRTVYAYYMCAAGPPGTPYDMSHRISGPVAVVLTSPPQARIAQAGEGYPDRVRAMIPPKYQERAFGSFRDQTKPLGLRSRYEATVARATT